MHNVDRYVLFVLDTSGSIGPGNFEKILNIVSDIIPLFCGNISFAIMTFGNIMKQEICFDCTINIYEIKEVIKRIKYRNGPRTRTGKAAKCACEHMLKPRCGYKDLRNTKFTDVIFITDGQSNGDINVCSATDCFNEINDKNPDMDLYVFAIGIGDVNPDELDCIVGKRGTEASKFYLTSFQDFEKLRNETVAKVANQTIACFKT